ncbi:hypothetical protein ACJQWY_05835 [Weissella kandleri]|uniref:hypothetical protein n=1 Tax=Weissella kandleri TaxID=1616 RepID=UPI00387E28AB
MDLRTRSPAYLLYSLIIGCLVVFLGCFLQSVKAQVVSTPIQIQITPTPILLEDIRTPDFSTQYSQNPQHFQAKRPLRVRLKVNTAFKQQRWQLQFKLSAFKNQTNGKTIQPKYQIDAGQFKALSGDIGDTQAFMMTGTLQNEVSMLQLTNLSTGEYEYNIPARQIQMSLPAAVQAGDYTATQTVSLISSPNVP